MDSLPKSKYKGKSPFKQFLQHLSETNQDNLRLLLEDESTYAKYVMGQKEDKEAIKLKLKVRKCFVILIEKLNLESTCLLELCVQEGILNDDDISVLRYLPATKKARQFLSILECRKHNGKSPYPYFLQALVDSEQDYLMKAIEEKEITEEDFEEYESKNNV